MLGLLLSIIFSLPLSKINCQSQSSDYMQNIYIYICDFSIVQLIKKLVVEVSI